jgi:hypothetical protein
MVTEAHVHGPYGVWGQSSWLYPAVLQEVISRKQLLKADSGMNHLEEVEGSGELKTVQGD